MSTRLIVALCVLGLCVAAGCGGDDVVPLVDAGALDSGLGGNSLTVLAFETVNGVAVPIAVATVALDQTGTGRVEQTTGADGKTTFVGAELTAKVDPILSGSSLKHLIVLE